MNETLKTNDQTIKELKQQLLYLTHLKIAKIHSLEGLSCPANAADAFRVSSEGLNLQKVLNQYSERYAKDEEKLGLAPECSGQ